MTTAVLLLLSSLAAPFIESACNVVKNGQSVSYNVQFLIDESGSVSLENYYKSIDFVKKFINNTVSDYPTNVSAYSFSSSSEQWYSFDNTQNDGRNGVMAALDSARNDYTGEGTSTADALSTGMTDFENSIHVTPSDANAILLLTDGIPGDFPCGDNEGVSQFYDNYYYLNSINGTDISYYYTLYQQFVSDAIDIRQRISDYNVKIFLILVGAIDYTRLECLTEPKNVIQIDGFSDQDFEFLEQELETVLCDSTFTTSAPAPGLDLDLSDIGPYLPFIYAIIGVLILLCLCIIACICCCCKGKKAPQAQTQMTPTVNHGAQTNQAIAV